jgi:hypothetical protein
VGSVLGGSDPPDVIGPGDWLALGGGLTGGSVETGNENSPEAPGEAVGAGAAVSGTWYRPSGRDQIRIGGWVTPRSTTYIPVTLAKAGAPGAAMYCST